MYLCDGYAFLFPFTFQFKPNAEGKVHLKSFKKRFVYEAKQAGRSPEALQHIIDDIDQNGDNYVDYEEFCYLVCSVIEFWR